RQGDHWSRRRGHPRRAGSGNSRRNPREGRREPVEFQPMAYRTELEARIAKKTTRAIIDYEMIQDGGRIMVGLSGGKDSWALIQILDVLQQRSPVKFSVVAVNVDSGYKEYKHDVIARTCRERG